jgi:dephospho-CoA kinase
MIIVGLTGGLGTGKSTVTNLFRELGAYIVDWDELARRATRPRSKAWKEITEHFGTGILDDDLTINRQKLARIVFFDKTKLAKLNKIVHPEVFKEDERITDEIAGHDPDAIIVKDIPLLFEVGLHMSVDKIVVVTASEQTRLRRLKEKGISREDARNRMKSQLPLEDKTKSADFIIDNDGSLEETRRQVENLHSLLRSKGKYRSQKVRERRSLKTNRG